MRQGKIVFAGALAAAALAANAAAISSASSGKVAIDTTFTDGESLSSTMNIYYAPIGWDDECRVTLDGASFLGSTGARSYFTWQPRKTGSRKLIWSSGGVAMTSTVNVVSIPFSPPPTPNPPMAKDANIGITPTTRTFEVGGGGGAIVTSGSGTWTAAVSDPWITLNATSGSAGYPVAYTVAASTNVGDRTGYVYVSGYTHTITQLGCGATVSPMTINKEAAGGNSTVSLETSGAWAWDAIPGADWIRVNPPHGTGSKSVTVSVAPYCEVSTRSTTVMVGGQTVMIFQNGRPMKLSTNEEWCDYLAHVIPLTVNALAVTTWGVTPNANWISVVDGGNGRGGDSVSVAVAENPSYAPRTGTVTIGTETLTIHQKGRTALQFAISPASTSASVTGANGLITVTATPDLPWTATSEANWLTVVSGFSSGSGSGNIVYTVSPNPTLSSRSGKITVKPEAASGLAAKTHTVSQPAAQSAISKSAYEFEAGGESTSVDVTVDNIVEWSIVESLSWIEISGSTSRVGPGSVTIRAVANDTVYPRSGTVKIADKNFSVSQKARGVEVEYESRLFGTDGGFDSFSVHPDGNVSWTAESSDPTWITVFGTTSGTGDAEVEYVVSPYTGTGASRTGTITVGDKKIYITQRAYELSINPSGEWVTGNSGAGQVGITAGIGDVWNAIVTEPWITIVTGYDAGTGNGTVRYTYTENNTGKTRTGKIIVAGEVYTLTQAARVMVQVSATAEGGGSVSGAGTYTLGESVTLTAIPDSGFEFLYWSGSAGETMQNPLPVMADEPKNFTAHFGPLPPEFVSAESSTDGVSLTWNALAWATEYRIYRAPASETPSAALATLPAAGGCSYFDGSGTVAKTYWYWIEAVGESVSAECRQPVSGVKVRLGDVCPITYTNLKGATHGNPSSYREGIGMTFAAPTGNLPAGYTFVGWSPASLAVTNLGAATVSAKWSANSYAVTYALNGGTHGSTHPSGATYDTAFSVSAPTRMGYTFAGWTVTSGLNTSTATWGTGSNPSTAITGSSTKCVNGATDTVYFKNLTTAANGGVTLAATWTANSYAVTLTKNGGTCADLTSYTYGIGATLPTPTRTGYTFGGWFANSSFTGTAVTMISTTETGTKTFYAKWMANSYAVTLNKNGGTCADLTSYTYGTGAALPTPMRTGYTFCGWFANSSFTGTAVTMISTTETGTKTFHAKWSANSYAVTYALNGGTHGSTHPTSATYGTAFSVSAPTRTGCTFAGWTVTSGLYTSTATWGTGSNPSTAITGSSTKCVNGATGTVYFKNLTTAANGGVTLAATWTANSYAVTLTKNGGTCADLTSYTYGIGATLPTPTRTGYTFGGWFANSSFTGTAVTAISTADTGAKTFHAKWSANRYAVTYALNGGTHGSTHPSGATYDTAFSVSAPTRTGYTFTGWTVTSGLNTSTAKWGTGSSPSTAITGSSTKCANGANGTVYFKNLTAVANGSVTLTAQYDVNGPDNDNFASATVLRGSSGSASGSNVGATSQSGEPLLTSYSGATTTVWWKWTAPSSGTVTFDTVGSGFDTIMGIYRGASLTSLARVAINNDRVVDWLSETRFSCTSGTTYYICVAGYWGATGRITLHWDLTSAVSIIDFDGDGRCDIAVYDPRTANWHSEVFGVAQYGWGSTIPTPADYDGDGITDYAAYDQADGAWYILYSADNRYFIPHWGWTGALPVPADYDGDGCADICVFDTKTSTWYIHGTSEGDRVQQFGWAGVVPVPADYDGDGRIDLAVYSPHKKTGNVGAWYILRSSDGATEIYAWGWDGAIPTPADFDGDGKADLAVFNRLDGFWYIHRSSVGGDDCWVPQYGWKTATPVPADYDGDGIADLGIYDLTTGIWYTFGTTEGHRERTFGWRGAVPLNPIYWIHRWFGL